MINRNLTFPTSVTIKIQSTTTKPATLTTNGLINLIINTTSYNYLTTDSQVISENDDNQINSNEQINENLFIEYNQSDESNSTIITDPEYLDFTQINLICSIFIILYLIVIIFSLVGNLIVIGTVIFNRKMQTVVNYYIVNLAICDSLVGFFVAPIKLIELIAPPSWSILNDDLCTALLYLQTVIVFTSVLTLVAICFERYFAVVHPLTSRIHQSKSRTIKILHGVWYIPLISATPFLMPSKATPNRLTSNLGTIERVTCFTEFSASFRSKYYTCLFIFFYLIPLILIGWTCYQIARCLIKQTILQREGLLRRQEINRRKIAKMILVVVLAFTISWTPYFLVTIVTQYQKVNFMHKHNYFFTMLSINLFAFLNSSVNPFIYVLMSTRFRLGFTNILKVLLCVSTHDELEESDRIVSGDQPQNQVISGGGQPIDQPDMVNQRSASELERQLTSNPENQLTVNLPFNGKPNETLKGKLTSLAKYRYQLVRFICGQSVNLSNDSGHSESSPPVSGYLTDKPTEVADDYDDAGDNQGKRQPNNDNYQDEKVIESKSININESIGLFNQLQSQLDPINCSTLFISSSSSPPQPQSPPTLPLSSIISNCTKDQLNHGSIINPNEMIISSEFGLLSKQRRYSDNLLNCGNNQLTSVIEKDQNNQANYKLSNTPSSPNQLLIINQSTSSSANCANSKKSNINNNQSGPVNYNRSKSEPHFITSTQL